MLSACGDTDEFAVDEDAADAPAPPGPETAPRIAQPLPGAAPGVMEPGTMTDPAAAGCGATKGADFIGQPFGDALFESIAHIVPPGGEIRVVRPGDGDDGDARADRLNVMLDNGGIVRDLRCG